MGRQHVEAIVKSFERKRLLERVEREGATVGAQIPESVCLDGETVALREFVFETKRLETVPPEHQERVDEVVTLLRRERLARKQRLTEEAELDLDTGTQLAEEIIGIDRALNALETLESTDIETEQQQAEQADQARWLTFIRQALGHEDVEVSR